MTEHNTDFRARLLGAQMQDEQLMSKYQQEIKTMLEHKLTRPLKWLLIALTILCLLAAVLTATNLSRWSREAPLAKEMGICALVFELALAACLGWIILRGSLRAAGHSFALAAISGVLSVCAAGIFADAVRDLPKDQQPRDATMISVIGLVLGWLPMVLVTISYYHNRTREKLLEIQYQLAELAEEVKRHR